MIRRGLISGAALVFATALITGRVVSQDNDATAAWLKLASPGPFHEKLKPLAGTFEATTKFWAAPGAAPTEAHGTSVHKLILGGRYLQQDYEAKSGDVVTMAGHGLMGYDNVKKKFTGVWVDTLSTSVMSSLGTCDESGKVITSTSEWDDPATGKPAKHKAVVTIESDQKHTYELYYTSPEGKEWKALEVVYAKK
ncbi:DUF1579 domain-containing protein [bacterium]|nr:DUF1579 domain-containing protein [bacterium]